MSRFRKLSHTIWHCQYHLVFVPKYRFRILSGQVGGEVGRCIGAFLEQQRMEVVELNVQIDHVHLLALIPPKLSVSTYVGTVKGRSAIRVFNRFRHLKHRPYWGNHTRGRNYRPNFCGRKSIGSSLRANASERDDGDGGDEGGGDVASKRRKSATYGVEQGNGFPLTRLEIHSSCRFAPLRAREICAQGDPLGTSLGTGANWPIRAYWRLFCQSILQSATAEDSAYREDSWIPVPACAGTGFSRERWAKARSRQSAIASIR